MGSREEALRRIISLDAGRSAQLSLRVAQDKAQARAGAVLAVDGSRYVLFASTELDQDDLSRIASAWREDDRSLLAGRPVVRAEWAVIPIGRPVAGLVYLGGVERALSGEVIRQLVADLGGILELTLSVRDREPEHRAMYEAILERTPLSQIEREKLILMLRANDGNKARVANLLGVSRPTLYKWLARHGIKDPLT